MLVNSWKENFNLKESENSQNACVDAAGPQKSIWQCKDKIRKQSYKQAKDNSKRNGSDPQTSACFDDFNHVLGTRDEISLHNITHICVQEKLLLSDWDKNDSPENNFDNEISSSNQQNMENKSGNTAFSLPYEYP